MKIVVVGQGGREAALAHSFRSHGHSVLVTPGRAGIPGSTVVSALDLTADLFVIGPDQQVVDGLADDLRAQGKNVFAPGRQGGQLEGSKVFMKAFLKASGVPTANYVVFAQGHSERARLYLQDSAGPWVIKTDYLAAGKGVLVTHDRQEAIADATAKLKTGAIVIEDVLPGQEVSVMAITNGRQFELLPFAQDYKRVFDGDKGPNTGGMGAYAPAEGIVTPALVRPLIESILTELNHQAIDYRGALYIGLMVDEPHIRVLEINARFGDPETQVQLPLIQNDLADVLLAAAKGLDLPPLQIAGAAITVVMASHGYPENPSSGDVITGLEQVASITDSIVHHAGTSQNASKQYTTAGGRVLNVVGLGPTIARARHTAYQAVERIHFVGQQYRSDIGLKH